MGPHHNLVLSLERSGSSFTSAASVLTSFSLLLLGYLQPMSNSVGQVAASIAPQPLGNAHIPNRIQENVGCSTKPSLSLSLFISLIVTLPLLRQAQVIGQGCHLNRCVDICDTKMPVTPACSTSLKTQFIRDSLLDCCGEEQDSLHEHCTPQRLMALFSCGAQ